MALLYAVLDTQPKAESDKRHSARSGLQVESVTGRFVNLFCARSGQLRVRQRLSSARRGHALRNKLEVWLGLPGSRSLEQPKTPLYYFSWPRVGAERTAAKRVDAFKKNAERTRTHCDGNERRITLESAYSRHVACAAAENAYGIGLGSS